MRKTAFIGHRQIFANTLNKRLVAAITNEIKSGCLNFTMGTHGDFDRLALSTCRTLRNLYHDISIEVAITSLNSIITPDAGADCFNHFADVNTVIFDIEETHYKRRITISNQKMIDSCDTLICYVDVKRYQSGAKTALNYAKHRGLRIINLYLEEDTFFYGMTQEETEDYWKALYEKTINKNHS